MMRSTVACLLGLLLAGARHAEAQNLGCVGGQWTVPETFQAGQDNGFVLTFYHMEQKGSSFQGVARYKSSLGDIEGAVHGGIGRDDHLFGAEILWRRKDSNVSKGRYLGEVNTHGYVKDGTTYDELATVHDPHKWNTWQPMVCRVGRQER
jgi:hypothetical protein